MLVALIKTDAKHPEDFGEPSALADFLWALSDFPGGSPAPGAGGLPGGYLHPKGGDGQSSSVYRHWPLDLGGVQLLHLYPDSGLR